MTEKPEIVELVRGYERLTQMRHALEQIPDAVLTHVGEVRYSWQRDVVPEIPPERL